MGAEDSKSQTISYLQDLVKEENVSITFFRDHNS